LVGLVGTWLISPWIGFACYVAVGLIWLMPDRRMERVLAETEPKA
jgi:hypothetical protein